MLISIILPAKDASKHISECLDSIVGQTHIDWELIAVENGSEDNTYHLLKEFAQKDERIKVFQLPDANLIEALKKGYEESSGELIHRMDADDIMPLDKLKLMYDEYLKTDNKEVVITGLVEYFSDSILGDGYRRYAEWLNKVITNNTYHQNLYKECVIPSACWLIPRETFDRIGGFNSTIYPEDYDLCFRMTEYGLSIKGCNQVLHKWRDHTTRISRNDESYADNRFFPIKAKYFKTIHYDERRPLFLWGAGKNGKALAKELMNVGVSFRWVCDNVRKVGKDIYDIRMEEISILKSSHNPQIILAVASPEEQSSIRMELEKLKLKEGIHFWFFM